MRKTLLLLAFSCIFTICNHAQSSNVASVIDPRISKHFTLEEITSMSSDKFEAITYYYCDSYTIESSNVVNFDIQLFDITEFEQYRHPSEYRTILSNGLEITLKPIDNAIYQINHNPKNYRHD